MKPSLPLTKRQFETLQVVRDYLAVHGHAPTIADVAARLGTSAATARQHIDYLIARAFLKRAPRRPRSLRLTAAAKRHLKDVLKRCPLCLTILGEHPHR